MATADLRIFLDTARGVAREAGALIRAAFDGRSHAIDFKETNAADLVTQTDRAVEDLCLRRLAEAFPEHAFIGEETTSAAAPAARTALGDRPTWIIDPVDGTMNFCHGFPFTAVSIGLCIGRRPVVGVVFNPILDQLFHAAEGLGAFVETPAGTQALPLSPAAVPPTLTTALLATEYGAGKEPHVLEPKIATIRRIVTRPVAGRGIRSVGSAALSMCLVAEGSVDAYYEAGIHAWDVCAGIVIVREAGGVAVNWTPPAGAAAVADEPIDVMARSVLCVRGVKGAAAGSQAAAQAALVGQLRALIDPIEYPHD
ncbi:hypothetical protein HK105_202131 [Polyrhizophydium stewartii]|uniref:Inositol-1-monophosphatase n=1 Tax=Polyrhizophydium stewartii TaxID=2732419 RepID=A0ABR4NF96_9FUNG